MEKEQLVRNAVELAKKQGVKFSDGTPTFRPIPLKMSRIVFITNSGLNTSGNASIDIRFDSLDAHNEKSLANFLIRVFNEYSGEPEVKEIG